MQAVTDGKQLICLGLGWVFSLAAPLPKEFSLGGFVVHFLFIWPFVFYPVKFTQRRGADEGKPPGAVLNPKSSYPRGAGCGLLGRSNRMSHFL